MSFDNGICLGTLTIWPEVNQFCERDAFISSAPINGKVFLLPWDPALRSGSWYQSRGFCAANCASMVTIESDAEFTWFRDFLNPINKNAAWLGGQVVGNAFTTWYNGVPATYLPKGSGEFNQAPLLAPSCLSYWDTNNNLFYDNTCVDSEQIVCQRPANWTICGSGSDE